MAHILLGERLSGAEAVAWGLAHRAAPAAEFDAAVDDVVARLVAKDPAALARAKRLVHSGLEMPLAEGLAHERDEVIAHLGGDSAAAGIDAFHARPARST
jgi:enoyl-CoA hydratase/carnithine racemase